MNTEAEGRNCAMCRAWFVPHRRDQGYCSAECNKKAEAIELRRGRRIYRAAYHLRLWVAGEGRVGFGPAFRLICREVAAWHREDRAAQRLPPPLPNYEADQGAARKGVKV